MLLSSLEPYLEEIYQLSLEDKELRIRDIANSLGVSSPTVARALRKLAKEDFVQYKRQGVIVLTDEGEKMGNLLVKRNSVLQEFIFLINSNGDTEKEAEALAYSLSASTIGAIEKLVEFLKKNEDICEGFTRFYEEIGEETNDKGD